MAGLSVFRKVGNTLELFLFLTGKVHATPPPAHSRTVNHYLKTTNRQNLSKHPITTYLSSPKSLVPTFLCFPPSNRQCEA